MSLMANSYSHPFRIIHRTLAGTVASERAFLTDRVRALEDPVLPRRQASEDFGLHSLRAAEAQVGFQAGEAVGRKGRALLQEYPHLVLPIDIVEREGDEAEFFRRLGVEHL